MNIADKSCKFRDFRLAWTFGQLTPELRSQLIQFWLSNHALSDPSEAWRRTFEVGCIASNTNNELVGVSSVYIDRLGKDGESYWFYRTFIRPDSRVLGLSRAIFDLTFDGLQKTYASEPGAPIGVIIVTENPKLESPTIARIFERQKLEKLGTDQQGHSVWRKRFSDSVS